MSTNKPVHMRAVISEVDHAPAVAFRFGEEYAMLPLDQAFWLAHALTKVAVSAEYEALFARWLREHHGMAHEEVGKLLISLREYTYAQDGETAESPDGGASHVDEVVPTLPLEPEALPTKKEGVPPAKEGKAGKEQFETTEGETR